MIWETDRGRAVLFTQQVQIEDLSEESSLRASPGIFQELIPKAYELRVTAIGRRLFAAKLRSQEVEPAQLDYRAALDEVPIEPYELPLEVSEACLRVLEGLGLVFGCFDLIVTPTGEYVFLEVNEMGAFLWIEERLPEMRLLDAFCELLTQGRPDFIWEGRNSIRAADFDQIVETQLATSPTIHVAGERKVAKDTA
jgi:glutathione synthase/RimK-type ligase-like ATP-grasp enzyme